MWYSSPYNSRDRMYRSIIERARMKRQLLLCAILLSISTGAFAMLRKVEEDEETSGNPSTEQRVSPFDLLAQQASGNAAPEKKELKKRLKATKDRKEGSLKPSVKNDDEKAEKPKTEVEDDRLLATKTVDWLINFVTFRDDRGLATKMVDWIAGFVTEE